MKVYSLDLKTIYTYIDMIYGGMEYISIRIDVMMQPLPQSVFIPLAPIPISPPTLQYLSQLSVMSAFLRVNVMSESSLYM